MVSRLFLFAVDFQTVQRFNCELVLHEIQMNPTHSHCRDTYGISIDHIKVEIMSVK